jgi:PAS domain S-box-containing protein
MRSSSINKLDVDNTQYQEIKNKLDQIQQHHELILQSAGEGIYGLDCNGHTTFVNQAAAKMVGWELDEMIGKSQHELIHHTKPDGSPFLVKDCYIYAAFKDGKIHHVDNELFWRKDGSCFPVEYVSTPIKDDEGKLLGAVVTFKDISVRKEAERALKQANTDLQAALIEVETLKAKLEQENKYLQQEIKLTNNFEEIISQSKIFKKELSKVEQVAETDATVLIMGESGTGKELIARAVHNISKRKNSVMVKVNCAALPAALIESELFGHEKGAFTGALSQKRGRFELADRGTLFLDEIGEIPLELQSKLLRVLQEGEFERLGNSNTIKVDVRIIAATNKDLQTEVEKGNFREDLYYRLNVFPINAPPLRERINDVELLADHFLLKHSNKFGKKISVISQKVMDALIKYSWPGNVRELENVIERAVIITSGNKLDLGDWLPRDISNGQNHKFLSLEESERKTILKALEVTNWRISGDKGAAKLLNIKRTTLESRLKKLNIKRP